MWIKNLDPKSKIISVAIPLTKATGKIRIKKRNNFNEYGIPVPTKAEAFSPQCYVEWQIGYDVAVKEEEKLKIAKKLLQTDMTLEKISDITGLSIEDIKQLKS